jgi:hypothetical protein
MKILSELKNALLASIDLALLDESCTWIHQSQVELCRALPFGTPAHDRAYRELGLHAAELLRPWAPEECKRRKLRAFNNSYCPRTPYGAYHFRFTCEMVQELIWLRAEFKQGFRFGRNPTEPYRDANPYQDTSRSVAWDRGYILGICDPAKLRAWLRQSATLAQAGGGK